MTTAVPVRLVVTGPAGTFYEWWDHLTSVLLPLWDCSVDGPVFVGAAGTGRATDSWTEFEVEARTWWDRLLRRRPKETPVTVSVVFDASIYRDDAARMPEWLFSGATVGVTIGRPAGEPSWRLAHTTPSTPRTAAA